MCIGFTEVSQFMHSRQIMHLYNERNRSLGHTVRKTPEMQPQECRDVVYKCETVSSNYTYACRGVDRHKCSVSTV